MKKNQRISLTPFQRMQQEILGQGLIAVIDLEATCYNNAEEAAQYAKEIIEVGVAVLNAATGEISHKQSFYVKPTTSYVSYFCTELTGINPETVENAPSFSESIKHLEAYFKEHDIRFWMSHGAYDRNKLKSQAKDEGFELPPLLENAEWMNIKTLARQGLKRKNGLGLGSLLKHFKLNREGRAHRGADDAFNSAAVIYKLLQMGEGVPL